MKLIHSVILAACFIPGAWAADWRLAWSDEFNGSGLPDSSKWTFEKGFLRNDEKQFYTAGRKENTRIENGVLILEARKEKYTGPAGEVAGYTSASITTRNKEAWTYGRIEVRAKLPTGRGTWPAIWLLGADIDKVDWPKCGEIDVMENVGFDPDTIHGTIHSAAYNHVAGTARGASTKISKPWEAFHLYAIEWSAEQMDFFVDEQKYFTVKNEHKGDDAWPFDKPFYLILNVAVGGAWGGQHGIDDSIFPQRMEVDYVRVYKAGKT